MADGLVGAGCTRVLLADAVAVRPTVVAGEGVPGRTPPPTDGVATGVPLVRAAASTSFLLVAVSAETVVVRAKLAAVSCWCCWWPRGPGCRVPIQADQFPAPPPVALRESLREARPPPKPESDVAV